MAKFSFVALATVLAATANAAAPVAKKTIKLGNRKLRRGDAGTEALLKKARPYKKGGAKKVARRLEGDEEEEFAIDGSYSLQFSECIDVKAYDADLFDEDIVGYVEKGSIVAAQSYVLFHVCTDDTCYLDAEDDLYLVDLPTYLTNVATYHANKRTDFCEACNEFEDYCNPQEEEEEEAEEEEEEEDDEEDEEEEDEERRKLKQRKLTRKNITRKLANNKEYIDCDKCSAYECYVDEDDMDDGQQRQDELDEEVSEWIANLAQCQQTGTQWNGLDLYTGVMCSPYGDGVELAVFANEDCTWYTNQQSFQSVYNPYDDEDNNYNINYLTYAENFIKAAFSDVTPCLQTEYADPDEEEEENDDAENEDEEEEQYEVNQYCQGIMEENVISFNNCEAEEEEADDEADDDVAANYDWFTYDVKDADDVNEVCAALNAVDSADYSHVYDEVASGTWYRRNKKGTIVFTSQKEGLSGGAITSIVVVVLGALGAAGFFFMKTKNDKEVEAEYQGGEMS